MKSVIVLWVARLRGLSQKQLCRLLLASISLNVGIVAYVMAELPIVPIRPLCRDGDPLEYDTPRRAVEGRLARPFFDAFEQRFPRHMIAYSGEERRIYVTLMQSLDWSYIESRSTLSIVDLLSARLGKDAYQDLRRGRTAIPGLVQGVYPDCETMRKFATNDGEWSRRGPEPAPAQ